MWKRISIDLGYSALQDLQQIFYLSQRVKCRRFDLVCNTDPTNSRKVSTRIDGAGVIVIKAHQVHCEPQNCIERMYHSETECHRTRCHLS